MKKILFITSRLPYPLTAGYRIRIYHTAKVLAQKYQVDLLSLCEGPCPDSLKQALHQIFTNVKIMSFHKFWFMSKAATGIFSRLPLQVNYYSFDKARKFIEGVAKDYSLLFCEHIRTAMFADGIHIPMVIDLHDAISLHYLRAAKFRTGLYKFLYLLEGRRVLKYEIECIKKFDRSFIVSPFDKKFLLENSPASDRFEIKEKVKVIPVGVREEVLKRKALTQEEDWIAFFGRMAYYPNIDAARFFAREVFPELKKVYPNLKFLIIGDEPSKGVKILQEIKDVEVTGFVEDLFHYIEKAKIVVAPVRFGAGIQNKVLEGMSMGKAVLCSPLGAEGIEGKDGVHFFVARSKTEMVEKARHLLDNKKLRQEMGERARSLIEAKYSWAKIGTLFLQEVEKVAG